MKDDRERREDERERREDERENGPNGEERKGKFSSDREYIDDSCSL